MLKDLPTSAGKRAERHARLLQPRTTARKRRSPCRSDSNDACEQ